MVQSSLIPTERITQAILLIREGWAEPLDDESINTSDRHKKS